MDAAINWIQQKTTFIQPVHSLPRPDIPSHMVTCPLKPGCIVAFYRFPSTKPCTVKTSIDGLSANAPVDNPSASQRVCSAEWLLSGEHFKESTFSWSHFQRPSCPLEFFYLPVWFTCCFNRTMTEWLTLNRSAVCLVGYITPYHSNRLPSLCI